MGISIFGFNFGGDIAADGDLSIVNGRVFINGVEQSQGLAPSISAKGAPVERDVPVGGFCAVEAALPVEIVWKSGPASAKVLAAPNIQGLIELKVVGSDLLIQAKGNYSGKVAIELSSESLSEARLGGVAKLDARGVSAKRFKAKLAGSSSLSIFGRAEVFSVDMGGVAKLGASEFFAASALVDMGGSSQAEVAFENNGSFELSGASGCVASGDGALKVDGSGSASFSLASGVVSSAKIDLSGASRADMALSGSSVIKASGAAKASYAKAPSAQVPRASASGAGSVKERSLRAGEAVSMAKPAPVAAAFARAAPDSAAAPAADPSQATEAPKAPNRARR